MKKTSNCKAVRLEGIAGSAAPDGRGNKPVAQIVLPRFASRPGVLSKYRAISG
jgi:hypothetical protein